MTTLIVMGNGPSLRDVDFDLLRKEHSFGLNAAYRAYDRMNFYPTYFGCFDRVVTVSHMAAFFGLMDDFANGIHEFFFIMDFMKHPRAIMIDLKRDGQPARLATRITEFPDLGNSGANAAQVGVCLGYRRILLVGVDCRYTEQIEGMDVDGNIVTVKKTPKKNPNYWFDDYQRAGDRFNVPRTSTFQKPGWELFAKLAKLEGVDVFNCSQTSELQCFPTMPLEDALNLDLPKPREEKAPPAPDENITPPDLVKLVGPPKEE